jgi:hypothetical protein
MQSRRRSSAASLLFVWTAQWSRDSTRFSAEHGASLRASQPHADTPHQAATRLAGRLQGGRVGRHGGARHLLPRTAAHAHMPHPGISVEGPSAHRRARRRVQHPARGRRQRCASPPLRPAHSTAADACGTRAQASSLRARRTTQTARPSSPCSTRAATLCCVCRARMDGARLSAWA